MEYKVITCGSQELENALNKSSKEGWMLIQLCAPTDASIEWRIILYRNPDGEPLEMVGV